MTDSEDSNDTTPTILDLIRLEGLEVGEGCEGECGEWSVFCYKDEFLVFFKNGQTIDCKTLKAVIAYLNS